MHPAMFFPSFSLASLSLVLYYCGRAGAAVPITIQLKAQREKNFTPSMTPPSPRLILPLLSPIKSLNDSHASDTPPSFFCFCFFTVSIKLQVREIHRHAYKYG